MCNIFLCGRFCEMAWFLYFVHLPYKFTLNLYPILEQMKLPYVVHSDIILAAVIHADIILADVILTYIILTHNACTHNTLAHIIQAHQEYACAGWIGKYIHIFERCDLRHPFSFPFCKYNIKTSSASPPEICLHFERK